MAFVHGKDTYFSIDDVDLSAATKTSDLERSSDKDDVTAYGKTSHCYGGGLLDSKGSAEGTYDNDEDSGPGPVLKALVGQLVTVVRRVEGTGAGLPQESVEVLIEKYTETAPCDGYIKWKVEFQGSDDIDDTPQTA